MTDKPNLATRLEEPADGTNLVIRDSSGDWHLIRRNDQDAADSLEEPADERWFSSKWSYDEPEIWASILTYAVAVYRVGDKPIASFDPAAELAAADERAEVDRLTVELFDFKATTATQVARLLAERNEARAEVDRLTAERDRYATQLDAVRELHQPVAVLRDDPSDPRCTCGQGWPCRTATAAGTETAATPEQPQPADGPALNVAPCDRCDRVQQVIDQALHENEGGNGIAQDVALIVQQRDQLVALLTEMQSAMPPRPGAVDPVPLTATP